jgi:hypothetical protein
MRTVSRRANDEQTYFAEKGTCLHAGMHSPEPPNMKTQSQTTWQGLPTKIGHCTPTDFVPAELI